MLSTPQTTPRWAGDENVSSNGFNKIFRLGSPIGKRLKNHRIYQELR